MSSSEGARRFALWGVIGSVFIAATGVGSILPILPLYLRDRGTSLSLIGIVVGASLLAQGLGQWPAGWLSDRIGRRTLMVGGLIAAAIASFLFIVPMPVAVLVALRVVQGLGFAAALPAQRAAVADLVSPHEIGLAYGWLSGARIAGFIAGPALGGVLAVFGRWTVFAVTGGALLAGALVALATVPSATGRVSPRRTDELAGVLRRGRAGAALRGVLSVTIGIGYLIGIYDTIWSLYMRAIGASDWQVGLSFSLFAIPWVIVTPLAGWVSDRRDRRWIAIVATLAGTSFGPLYPFMRNIPLILAVGAVEASTWAFMEPPLNAYVMDAVPTSVRGQAQGMIGTAEGLAMAFGAGVGGAMFALGYWVPFVLGAAGCIVLTLAAIPFLRAAGEHRRAADLAAAID